MRVSVLLFLTASVFGQGLQPTPTFTGALIRPASGRSPKLLAPGMVVELWGENLAPQSCRADRVAIEKTPVTACGVRVLIGSREAELLYVSMGQINLKIPADVAAEGMQPFQVCVYNVCSTPVEMQFSAHTALIELAEPVYVHLPVWIHIDVPSPYWVNYPCGEWLWDFGDYDFEVTRNGHALSKLAAPRRPALGMTRPSPSARSHLEPPNGQPGCMLGSLNGRFPLHLLYSFDEPGIYSVRLTAHENGAVLFQSNWTDIEIQPFSEEKREATLKSLAGQTHVRNAEYVMGSLLSWPDEKALTVLKEFLPATDQIACVNYDCIRIGAATAALAGFDPQLLQRESVQIPR